MIYDGGRCLMRSYISEYMTEMEFDPRERVAVAIAYERISECKESRDRFQRIVSGYEKNPNYITPELLEEVKVMAEAARVNLYTAQLVLCIALTRKLRERLAQLKVTKKNIVGTISDFKYKMKECEAIHGVVGIEPWGWYVRVLGLSIIAIGRLQFEVKEYTGGTYRKGEKVLSKGNTVLSVHIPRNNEPLDEKLCNRAYKEAKAFFCSLLGVQDIAFFCSSWLLYEKNRELLPPTSNIVKFMNRFDIVESIECADERNTPMPFIFLKKSGTPISELPRDTSLRRAFAEMLENGGKLGYGNGIFFLEDVAKN